MDQRAILNVELDALYTASTLLVKKLKALKASPVTIAHFTNIAMKSHKLQQRVDYLLPTFRRFVEKLHDEFDSCSDLAAARFPELASLSSPSHSAAKLVTIEPTSAIRVSMTLPDSEWAIVDSLIKNKIVRSRAEYFRKLHYDRKSSE